MKEIWKEIIKFNDKCFPDWRKNRDLIYLSNALAGEVGEICNLVKKVYGGGTNKKDVSFSELAFEGIDVFIYLVLFFEIMGYNNIAFESFFRSKLVTLYQRMTKKELSS